MHKPFIHPTAIIYPNVTMEDDVVVGAYSVIGGPPEHRDYIDQPYAGVHLSRGARIFEFATIHSGTVAPTHIGQDTWIFNHAHVAHDVELGDNVTVAGHASVAGHVAIGDFAFIGGRATVHQHVVIGAYAMIGMCSVLQSHVPVGEMWMGHPARYGGINFRGLSRRKLLHDQAKELYDHSFLYLKGLSKL